MVATETVKPEKLTLHVLAIDDDADVHDHVIRPAIDLANKRLRGLRQFSLSRIESFDDAIVYINDAGSATIPTVIILDLELNGDQEAGLDVLDRIRSHDELKDAFVVMYSRSREKNTVCSCLRKGAIGYLCKFGRRKHKKEQIASAVLYLCGLEICHL